jgi:SAM-dependent methyltransferase
MATANRAATEWTTDLDLWRCLACSGLLAPTAASEPDGLACEACHASYPIKDGVLVVHEQTSSNNKVASDFYNSPLWPKFRFWEWLTFLCNGGEKRARGKVLGHLPSQANLRLLDVAIGDGVYLDWLPSDWKVVGIDVSTAQLEACRKREGAKNRDLRLILGEAEELPVRDAQFDAALSIGGFNYFNDPEKSLREMVRAVKPGGMVVVSDEVPDLTDRMIFRKLGLPGVDHWIVSKGLHLGDPFTEMVERHKSLDVQAIADRVMPGFRYERIWMGVGYVLVGQVPG